MDDQQEDAAVDRFQVNLGAPTLRNEDIIRQSYALKTYARSYRETIGWCQIQDKKQPSAILSDVTKDHFYMKEIKMTNPDGY